MIRAFYLQKGMFSIPFLVALLLLVVSLCPLSISALFPFLWLKALTELGTRLHTRALSHGNAPVPAQAVPQKQGYRITQVSSLFPFLNFYSAKVMHFRESIKFG